MKLELNNLSYTVNDNKKILDNISYSFVSSNIYSLVGPNGSGKTTLSKALTGLLENISGSILLDGEAPKSGDITMIFQNSEDQFVESIVKDDIAFSLECSNVPQNEMEDKIDSILEKVNLAHKKNENVNALSGGEKIRAALASTLVLNPKVIIFDESSSSLDPVGKTAYLNILKDLASDKIIINITHNMDELKISNKVICLKDGQILFSGSPKEFFNNDKVLLECHSELPLEIELSKKSNSLKVKENLWNLYMKM